MRLLRAVALFALAVFVGGALLGPCLYWLAQAAADTWPWCHSLAGRPLHRYVLRAIMLLAVLGLWPFLRSLGMGSRAELGLEPWRTHWPRLAAGIALGFGSLALIAGLAVVCGARELDGGLTGRWWGKLPGIAVTAILIGFLEELLYRGAIFGAIRRSSNWRIALVTSSVLYAAMHFLRHVESPPDVHWWSGLALLPHMAGGLTRLDLLIPGFIGLLVAGMVLALAYQRTGSLYFSIGLHAGWVFWLKSYNFMTDRGPHSAEWFWGSGKLIDGWVALLALMLVGVIVWSLGRAQPLPANGQQPA